MRNKARERLVFDVFLSHNGKDKPIVRTLAEALRARHLKVWLDEDELQPGLSWQELMEEGIRSSKSGAVLVAADGTSPWENEEMRALLQFAVKKKKPVIPVLLPGAPKEPELPLFLSNRTWVDLRSGLTVKGIDELTWGITGEKRRSVWKHGKRASEPAVDVLASSSHPEAQTNRKVRVIAIGAVALIVTIVVSKAILRPAAIDKCTLTISSTSGGSVRSPGEGSFQYDSGTSVSIQAKPNSNYYFVNWTGTAVSAGKVANSRAANTMVTMDASYAVKANFTWPDGVAPTVSNHSPGSDSIQVPLNSLIILHISDAGVGVDASSIHIKLDGATIYNGDVFEYKSATGNCRRTGTASNYMFTYQSDQPFGFDELKTVTVNAEDIGGMTMKEQSYSFTTEMRSFGQNKQVSCGLDSIDNGRPATVCDSGGNIWVVWHAGLVGSRDIYIAKLATGTDTFGGSIQLTNNSADQTNPAIALGIEDELYVVWQDKRRGDWDIYGSTSVNGTNWTPERRIADIDDNQNYNQMNPSIAIDGRSPNHAFVVWQEDHAGNYDIYIAESIDLFVTNAVTQVTSDALDQIDPAIAVSSSNTVYVLWADACLVDHCS